jgi:D-alanyl-D-alanine carboxypeptidase/D-alanyl-D-alanine-endopeptidase (penicillin-binding protein 4)
VLGLGCAALIGACGSSGSTESTAFEPQVGELPSAAVKIMEEAPYRSARWSYLVEPLDDQEEVLGRDPDVITPMGSNTKLFSVGTWVNEYGIDDTLTTPVHRVGDRLVLVASGDLTMGGRRADTGTLAYNIPPQPDAAGIPGAKPAPGNPLAGLDELARQVAASGIDSAAGVEIDSRLFEQWYAHDEVISPIVINDNLLVVQASATAPGQPAELDVIPDSQAFDVVNRVRTVGAGKQPEVAIVAARQTPQGDPLGRTLIVEGTIPRGGQPTLGVFPVPDPARFARTLFIEALERAGVSVAADPVVANSTVGLPATYPGGSQVAALRSPTVEATATLIWKISFNYGANLALCLLAVRAGSTDCTDGFAPIRAKMRALEIDADEVWLLDGSGESFSSTTPRAIVMWIKWLRERGWGDRLSKMLPILGVDGSLSETQRHTEATGKVQGKSGTWAGLDPSTGVLPTPDQSLAGLMQSEDGREYVFGLYQAGATFQSPADGVIRGTNDVNDVAAAIQGSR